MSSGVTRSTLTPEQKKQRKAAIRALARDPNNSVLAEFLRRQVGEELQPSNPSSHLVPPWRKVEPAPAPSVSLIRDEEATSPSPDKNNAATSAPDMLAAALWYAGRGMPVFPCEKGGKAPVGRLVPNGFKNATTDAATIKRWWSSGNWNIGVATGGGVVLDVDPRNGGSESLRQLLDQHGPLPPTWTANTGGGGGHVFFAQPAGSPIGCPKAGLPPGLDIKGCGGYVIVTPSVHESGRPYEWLASPHNTPLAPMPIWLVELCRGASVQSSRFDASIFTGPALAEGARNERLTSLCGHLMRRLPSTDAVLVLELVWGFNVTRCSPPLARGEVEMIVNSIAGREARRRGA